MPTAQTLIDAALKKIGVYAPGETPETTDRNHALNELNLLISDWQTQRRFAYYTRIDVFTMSTSAQTYTIGPSGSSPTFSLGTAGIRPLELLGANLIRVGDTPDTRVPLAVFNIQDYSEISDYLQTADEPSALYYAPEFPLGKLFPLPYLNTAGAALANKLELYSKFLLASFADLNSTNYDLPPGYENAIMLSLAEVLCVTYGKPITPELERMARKARRNIQSLNSKPPQIATADSGLPDAGSAAFRPSSTTRVWR